MALASGAGEAAANNGLAAVCSFANLCSASPGTTGANELGSTRQAVSWTTGNSGTPAPTNTGALTFSLAASTTAAYIAFFTLVTAGVYEIGGALSPTVTTGSSAGTVTIAPGAASLSSS